MTRANPRCAFRALAAALLISAPASSSAEPAALVAPSLGRPVFVPPGRTFDIVATVPDATGTASFALVRHRPPLRFPLTPGAEAAGRLTRGEPQPLALPADIPPGTYDVEIRIGPTTLTGRHCVAVGHVPNTLRIAHLSNMNLGDVAAPYPDGRLIEEINLLGPTLIVGTGDYIDNTHPEPRQAWRQFIDFVTRFDAPLLLACGDHEDMTLYGQHVAPSPIGVVDVGPHRGIVLFDVPARPLDADADQLTWVRSVLLGKPPAGVSFVVSHDDSPNLLRRLLADGALQKVVAQARLAAWFSGGQRDWDGLEYRDVITAAAPLAYVRTQQSSPAARGGADGVSHYRVIDLEAGRVRFLGDRAELRDPQAGSSSPLWPSTARGRLTTTTTGPNDGSATRVELTATNHQAFLIERAGADVFLRRSSDEPVWCRGARLLFALPVENIWCCRVEFDLPEFGVRHVALGVGSPPPEPAAAAEFELPPGLEFRTGRTADGVEYQTRVSAGGSAEGVLGTIWVSSRASGDSVLTPLVRLDGNPLAYRPADGRSPFAIAHRLKLKPGERLALQVDLTAVRVRPGRRTMQVYWNGEPQWPPAWYPLNVVVRP